MAPLLYGILLTLQLASVADTVRIVKRRKSSLSSQASEAVAAGSRCTSLQNAETVLDWFRKPVISEMLPEFNYLLWLDQAALADGGEGMSSVDPEGLVYIESPDAEYYGFDFKVNRCAKRQWSLYGNNISSAGESSLTYQGSEFMKGLSDDRCELEMEFRSEGTIRIGNYFWSTYRIPLVDATMDCTIKPNQPFHTLIKHVQGASAEQFEPMLRAAVKAQGDWGKTCCPGAHSGPTVAGDVVATCRPPLTKECALWHRENWPTAPGLGGYSVYAVAYASLDTGAWVPIPGAYAKFEENMKKIGVESLCFEREA